MTDLLTDFNVAKVDILKVDIEGGEIDMFRGDAPWLCGIGTLMIELHGPDCESMVATACEGLLCRAGQRGEISVWSRITNHS